MRLLLALGALGLAGCYLDHGPPDLFDAGAPIDAALADAPAGDAGPPPPPCTTLCDAPRVLARVPLDLGGAREPAVLGAVVHRDELVVLLLVGSDYRVADPEEAFSLVRVSRRSGSVRIEPVAVRTSTAAIGAGALASRGETLTLVAAHARDGFTELEPQVLVARWEGATPMPTLFVQPFADFEPSCAGCFRRGAAVAIGESAGIVALAGEGLVRIGRVSLETGDVIRETISVPGVVPNTATEASGRGASALLTLGGLRETVGALGSPALVMRASEAELDAPIAIPGSSSDSVPHAWLREGASEIVRFQRDEGLADGRLHRYAVEGSGVVEVGTIETSGDLPPLAMASTASSLLWVESSITLVGEADLRVLTGPAASCGSPTPATTVHLPRAPSSRDPRTLAAAEADGRTYAAFVEQAPRGGEAALVVVDLGACR